MLGLCWGYIGVMLGLYWGYIGVLLGLYWGYVGVILGFGPMVCEYGRIPSDPRAHDPASLEIS